MQEKDVFIFYNIYIKPIYSEIEARLSESTKNDNTAFEKWFQTSNQIDEFEQYFFNEDKLVYAQIMTKKAGQSQFWWGFLASFVASVLLTLVAWLYEIIQIRILW